MSPLRSRRLVFLASAIMLVILVTSSVCRKLAFTPTQFRIVSGSMAPAVLGPHFSEECSDCGFRCEFDATRWVEDWTCINCGQYQALTGLADIVEGQLVQVLPTDRFRVCQMAMLHGRLQPGIVECKRIVGLPGQLVELIDGDVCANGTLVQKDVSALRRVAILVYDDQFRPRSIPARWNPSPRDADVMKELPPGEAAWHRVADGFRCALDGVERLASNSLVYRHSEALPPPHARGTATELLDNYGYNQSTSRTLCQVSDWFAEFEIVIDSQVSVTFEILPYGIEPAEARLDLPKLSLLLKSSGLTHHVDMPKAGGRVIVGHWDGQYVVANDGKELLRVASVKKAAADERPRKPELGSFRLWGEGRGSVAVTGFQIWRDIHYAPIPGGGPIQLGSEEYLLLGDNRGISNDTRNGRFGVVSRSQLKGVVELRAMDPSTARSE